MMAAAGLRWQSGTPSAAAQQRVNEGMAASRGALAADQTGATWWRGSWRTSHVAAFSNSFPEKAARPALALNRLAPAPLQPGIQPRCNRQLASRGSSFVGLGPGAAPCNGSAGQASCHVSRVGGSVRAQASTAPPRAESSEDSPPRSFAGREAVHRLAEMDDWADALDTLEQFKSRPGFMAEAIHYNIVLKLLGAAGEWQLAENLYLEMEASPEGGLSRPDNYTFSTLISSAVRLEQYDVALSWIERMAGTPGCYPDQVTYSTIIHALGKAGQPNEALRVFRKMVDAGWDLDTTTYGTVLSLYVTLKQYSAAGSLFLKLQEVGLPLSEAVYNCMLTAYRDQGASSKAVALVKEMQEAGVAPSAATHSLVLGALAKAGEFKEMMDYYERAKAGGIVDAGVFNAVIGAYRTHGNLAAAAEIYKEMVAAGVPGDDSTYRLMMSVFSELGRAEEVARVKQALETIGTPMDIRGYSNMIQGYARAGCWDALEGVVAEMRSVGIEADAQLTCILLSLMAQSVPREAGELGVYRSGGELGAGLPSERLLWCLEQLNSVAAWELVTAVRDAESRGVKESGIGSMTRELLGGTEGRAQKVTSNGLLDLLWAMGRLEDALAVWKAALSFDLYPDVFPRVPFAPPPSQQRGQPVKRSKWTPTNPLGQLDLRQLSVGAAHVALFDWLGRLDKAQMKGQRLPRVATIAVGRGHFKRETAGSKSRAGVSTLTMREQIHRTLEALYAPFTFDPADPRMLVAREEELADFLDSEWGIQFEELCASQPRAMPSARPAPPQDADTSSSSGGARTSSLQTDSRPGSLQAATTLQGAPPGAPATAQAAGAAPPSPAPSATQASTSSAALRGEAPPALDGIESSRASGGEAAEGQGSLSGRLDGFAASVGDVRSRLVAFKAEIDGLAAQAGGEPQQLQSSALAAPEDSRPAEPGPMQVTAKRASKGTRAAASVPAALEAAAPQAERSDSLSAGGSEAGDGDSGSGQAGGQVGHLTAGPVGDGQYWELDGFGGWQGPEGWMKKCRCGKVWGGRKRKCDCSLSLPTKEAVKAGGTCRSLEAMGVEDPLS